MQDGRRMMAQKASGGDAMNAGRIGVSKYVNVEKLIDGSEGEELKYVSTPKMLTPKKGRAARRPILSPAAQGDTITLRSRSRSVSCCGVIAPAPAPSSPLTGNGYCTLGTGTAFFFPFSLCSHSSLSSRACPSLTTTHPSPSTTSSWPRAAAAARRGQLSRPRYPPPRPHRRSRARARPRLPLGARHTPLPPSSRPYPDSRLLRRQVKARGGVGSGVIGAMGSSSVSTSSLRVPLLLVVDANWVVEFDPWCACVWETVEAVPDTECEPVVDEWPRLPRLDRLLYADVDESDCDSECPIAGDLDPAVTLPVDADPVNAPCPPPPWPCVELDGELGEYAEHGKVGAPATPGQHNGGGRLARLGRSRIGSKPAR
ncbi:hypothetical protein K438DRAFT_1926887 [Mycena galopus ATCC 62051]|nr:hypothetical protein K438DRAFT_1926887 [Mycena galopus ATCC 62051]